MAGLLRTLVNEVVGLCAKRGVPIAKVAKELELRSAIQGSSEFDLSTCPRCGSSIAKVKGSALRKMRKQAQLRLREIGELTGFGPGYLSRIEREHRPASPKIEAAYRAAVAAAERKEEG